MDNLERTFLDKLYQFSSYKHASGFIYTNYLIFVSYESSVDFEDSLNKELYWDTHPRKIPKREDTCKAIL